MALASESEGSLAKWGCKSGPARTRRREKGFKFYLVSFLKDAEDVLYKKPVCFKKYY